MGTLAPLLDAPQPADRGPQGTSLITQMTQTAAYNRHHSLDQQLCRWLLLSLDRLPGSDLVMTQELIANMLGVRRESVTEAALNADGRTPDPARRWGLASAPTRARRVIYKKTVRNSPMPFRQSSGSPSPLY